MSLKRQLDGLGRPQPHDLETKAPTAQVEPHTQSTIMYN